MSKFGKDLIACQTYKAFFSSTARVDTLLAIFKGIDKFTDDLVSQKLHSKRLARLFKDLCLPKFVQVNIATPVKIFAHFNSRKRDLMLQAFWKMEKLAQE